MIPYRKAGTYLKITLIVFLEGLEQIHNSLRGDTLHQVKSRLLDLRTALI